MHPSLRGIPDLVLEGDGYTLEFIGPTLLCVDIRKLTHFKLSFLQKCSMSRPAWAFRCCQYLPTFRSFNSSHSNRSVYRVEVWPGGVWVKISYLLQETKFLLDKSKQLEEWKRALSA